jgi:26S proteasome regulatory subunit N6
MAAAQALATRVSAAREAAASDPAASACALRAVITAPHANDADCLKIKEEALHHLTDLLVQQQNASALRDLLTDLRQLFVAIPKAKTAKIVRSVIDSIAKVPNSTQLLVRRCLQPAALWGLAPPRR